MLVALQHEPAPVPPPLKSPWAQIVKQQPRSKQDAAREVAARALGPPEGSKASTASTLQDPMSQQGKANERTPRDGPPTSEDNGVRQKTAELQSKKAPQHGGTPANAANTAPRSVSGAKSEAQPIPAPMQKPEASAPVSRSAGSADSKAEGTAVSSGDGKDTPRHHEVTCMTASLLCILLAVSGLYIFRDCGSLECAYQRNYLKHLRSCRM